ncbi:MAG: hypothetical protein RLZZ507_674 [Cyanobacteriota bacterium]|jgi:hypothetical protein
MRKVGYIAILFSYRYLHIAVRVACCRQPPLVSLKKGETIGILEELGLAGTSISLDEAV